MSALQQVLSASASGGAIIPNPLAYFQIDGKIQSRTGGHLWARSLGHASTRIDTIIRSNSSTTANPPSDAAGNYTAHGGSVWGIRSNKIYLVTAGSPDSVLSLDTSSATQDITVGYASTGDDIGLAFRVTDESNCLIVNCSNAMNSFGLYKKVAGSFTLLGQNVMTVPGTGTLRATASGNTLNVYLNGSLIIGPITESAQNTATRAGYREGGSPSATANFTSFASA